mmetsp:Transcript_3333/g.6777  ORF Transcript_3333/g.6777 Transcript_3333/m.6777 type:complete len:142 (+) Transcript_3333:148-573(+)
MSVFFTIRSTEQKGLKSSGYEEDLPEELAEYGIQEEEWDEFIMRANKVMKYDWFAMFFLTLGFSLLPLTWYFDLQNWIIHKHMRRMCRKVNRKHLLSGLHTRCQWEAEGDLFGEKQRTKSYHYIHFSRRKDHRQYKNEEDY